MNTLTRICYIFLYMYITSIAVAGQLTRNRDRLLNWCLDGRNHKSSPGPEAELYSQCTPWKERSCCTSNTTKDIHHSFMYNFDWNHCSHVNRNLSEECRRHFQQDLCFYECSPNIGPWVVTVQMKIRNERFVDVPLCQSDCNAWFNACAKDFTCVQNWVRDFNWKGGKNVCPPESECRTFEDIYKTDKNFCEKVWDHSWKFTSDAQPCMRLWFNGSLGNPNDDVAKLYAEKLVSSSASRVISSLNFIVALYAFLGSCYARLTSCDVERLFLQYKVFLVDNRHAFVMDNLEMTFVVHCNSETTSSK